MRVVQDLPADVDQVPLATDAVQLSDQMIKLGLEIWFKPNIILKYTKVSM